MSIDKLMAKRWLTQLIRDNGPVEVRVSRDRRWLSGWFDNVEDLHSEISRYQDANAFTSLNRPASVNVTNRIEQCAKALRDDNVDRITRIFFDFDPKRPTGSPATETEVSMAQDRSRQFMRAMSAYGWPRPAVGSSGNGAHLLYRTSIPVTEDLLRHLGRLYAVLAEQYTDDWVDFDRTVRNPARLTRLYGTINVKGIATPDRPHRLSSIWMPDEYRPVSQDALWALIRAVGADQEPERPSYTTRESRQSVTGTGDYNTLNVVSWFQSKGLYLKFIEGNKHAVNCPWQEQHSCSSGPGETIIYAANNDWPGFFCHHMHCAERSIRDVMVLFGDADKFCARDFRRELV